MISTHIIAAIWAIIAIGFAVGEYFSFTFFLIPFSIGAIIALIALMIGAPLWLQIILFIAVSVILIPLLRPFAQRVTKSADKQAVGINRVLGEEAYVTEKIIGEKQAGKVSVKGEIWIAVADDETSTFEVNEKVIVACVDGTKLRVKA